MRNTRSGRSIGFAANIGFIFGARFAQPRAQIDQTGADNMIRCIDDSHGIKVSRLIIPESRDFSILNIKVGLLVNVVRGVDNSTAFYKKIWSVGAH